MKTDLDLMRRFLTAAADLRGDYRFRSAVPLLRHVISQTEKHNEPEYDLLRAKAHDLLGNVRRDQERIFGRDGALAHLSVAIHLYEAAGAQEDSLLCRQQLGVSNRLGKKASTAVAIYDSVIAESGSVAKGRLLEGNSRRDLATALLMLGRFGDADRELTDSATLLDAAGDEPGFGITLQKLAIREASQGKLRNACRQIVDVLPMVGGNRMFELLTNMMAAAIFLDARDTTSAQNYVEETERLYSRMTTLPHQLSRLRFLQATLEAARKTRIADLRPRALILGPDSTPSDLALLHDIRAALPPGIEAILIKEHPDQFGEGLQRKVQRFIAENVWSFVLMERSKPSGHLTEIEIAQHMNCPVVGLRRIGAGDSFMVAENFALSANMYEREYSDTRDLKRLVPWAADWCLDRLVRRAAVFERIYEYRPESAGSITSRISTL